MDARADRAEVPALVGHPAHTLGVVYYLSHLSCSRSSLSQPPTSHGAGSRCGCLRACRTLPFGHQLRVRVPQRVPLPGRSSSSKHPTSSGVVGHYEACELVACFRLATSFVCVSMCPSACPCPAGPACQSPPHHMVQHTRQRQPASSSHGAMMRTSSVCMFVCLSACACPAPEAPRERRRLLRHLTASPLLLTLTLKNITPTTGAPTCAQAAPSLF